VTRRQLSSPGLGLLIRRVFRFWSEILPRTNRFSFFYRTSGSETFKRFLPHTPSSNAPVRGRSHARSDAAKEEMIQTSNQLRQVDPMPLRKALLTQAVVGIRILPMVTWAKRDGRVQR